MRIAAIADLHGYLPELPPCDVLVIAGDICPDGRPGTQLQWLGTKFRAWLPKKTPVVAVWGNHDFVGARVPVSSLLQLPVTFLQDDYVVIDGVKFHGTPWHPWINDWWVFGTSEERLADHWQEIQPDTDVLISHGPPYQILDRCLDGEHVGSKTQRAWLDAHPVPLTICGHIHEAVGNIFVGKSHFANVSLVDFNYQPINAVQIFEVAARKIARG